VAAPKGSLKNRLSRYRQIKLGVTGRKSGKTISVLVWFVLEGEKLYLLPVPVRYPMVQERAQEPDGSDWCAGSGGQCT